MTLVFAAVYGSGVVIFADSKAASPEEFVARVVGLGDSAWTRPRAMFSVGRTTGDTCAAGGRLRRWPSTRGLAHGRMQMGQCWARGCWFRAVRLFKRGREWLTVSSCRKRLPLTGWQRALADVLLARVRE